MKKTLLEVLDDAKQIIPSLGGVPCLAFPIIDNTVEESFPIFFENDIEKLKTFFAIGAYSYEKEFDGLILVLDGCNKEIPDKDKDYFFENLDIERPTLYPRKFRNNFIIIQFIDFIKSEHLTLLCEYEKKENKYEFTQSKFTDKIESVLVELTVDGWNTQYDIDEDEAEEDYDV